MRKVNISFTEDGLYYRVVITKVAHNHLLISVNDLKSWYNILPGDKLEHDKGHMLLGPILGRVEKIIFQYFQYMSESRQPRHKIQWLP